jgi:hypothetical protein
MDMVIWRILAQRACFTPQTALDSLKSSLRATWTVFSQKGCGKVVKILRSGWRPYWRPRLNFLRANYFFLKEKYHMLMGIKRFYHNFSDNLRIMAFHSTR